MAKQLAKELKYTYGVDGQAEIPKLNGHRHRPMKKMTGHWHTLA